MNTPREQSPSWVPHIITILEGEQDHLFTEANNDLTFKMILGCLKTLMANTKLSDKQKNVLINNIKLRVPGKHDFSWEGDVVLTRKMRHDANKREDVQRFLNVLKLARTANSLIMEVVEEKLEEVDFTDPEILAAFREHIRSFDPSAS